MLVYSFMLIGKDYLPQKFSNSLEKVGMIKRGSEVVTIEKKLNFRDIYHGYSNSKQIEVSKAGKFISNMIKKMEKEMNEEIYALITNVKGYKPKSPIMFTSDHTGFPILRYEYYQDISDIKFMLNYLVSTKPVVENLGEFVSLNILDGYKIIFKLENNSKKGKKLQYARQLPNMSEAFRYLDENSSSKEFIEE